MAAKFEMLKEQCRICGGWVSRLISGYRCLSCAYTPAGRPIGNGGWDAGMSLPEPDWQALFDAACQPSSAPPDDAEEPVTLTATVRGEDV